MTALTAAVNETGPFERGDEGAEFAWHDQGGNRGGLADLRPAARPAGGDRALRGPPGPARLWGEAMHGRYHGVAVLHPRESCRSGPDLPQATMVHPSTDTESECQNGFDQIQNLQPKVLMVRTRQQSSGLKAVAMPHQVDPESSPLVSLRGPSWPFVNFVFRSPPAPRTKRADESRGSVFQSDDGALARAITSRSSSSAMVMMAIPAVDRWVRRGRRHADRPRWPRAPGGTRPRPLRLTRAGPAFPDRRIRVWPATSPGTGGTCP